MNRQDNIGFLRLLFASFVIIGHTPELVDGNRSREPLTCIFHTLSLGEVSVDAFMLLSGYLITASIIRSSSIIAYFKRRILRIYPAYCAAFIILMFILAPYMGIKPESEAEIVVRTFLLLLPANSPQLAPLHYQNLDGAMWTIAYEFHCYILLAILNFLGFCHHKWRMTIIAVVLAIAAFATTFGNIKTDLHAFWFNHQISFLFTIGDPTLALRLTSLFVFGSVACLHTKKINTWLKPQKVLLCALFLGLAMLNRHTAELGIATFGGLLLFWLAVKANLGSLNKINKSWDISYGTYLYGWPVQTAFLWLHHGIAPFQLAIIALPVSYIMGAISWLLIERPIQRLLRASSSQTTNKPFVVKNALGMPTPNE